MISVDFYRNGDQKIGTLTWDGQRFTTDPPDSPRLKEVLQEPVYLPKGGGEVFANIDPEKFIRHLCWQYDGILFHASKPRETP